MNQSRDILSSLPQHPDLGLGCEAHRWFDYRLKGTDNGIMDEPYIHHHLLGSPAKEAWKAANA